MTKDKLTIVDLASLLSSKVELSQKNSEEYVKLFFELIEEALLSKDQVKIKNLGTFKLGWIESRKSVDVNTGEEITIDGYFKTVFTPDASLKDLVNAPFAHLEPVVLGENTEAAAVEEELAPLKTLNEQADEIKSILSAIHSMDAVEESAPETKTEIPAPEVSEEPAETEHEPAEIEAEIESEQETEPGTEPGTEPEAEPETEPEVVETPLNTELNEEKPSIESVKKKSSALYIWFLLILILASAGFFFRNQLSELFVAPDPVVVVEPVLVDTIPLDTMAAPIDTVAPQPVDSFLLWMGQNRKYTEFIGQEKMENGNRLTLISLKYYGAKEFWVYIYEANKAEIPNFDRIPVGKVIQIPKLPAYVIDLKDARCVEFAQTVFEHLKAK